MTHHCIKQGSKSVKAAVLPLVRSSLLSHSKLGPPSSNEIRNTEHEEALAKQTPLFYLESSYLVLGDLLYIMYGNLREV